MITTEQKAINRRNRMLEKAREFMPHNYLRKYVANEFQKMIRAEAGARVEMVRVWKQGTWQRIRSSNRMCVCVTCGKTKPWATQKAFGIEGIDAGHFIGGRRASILLEETNCHPQCQYCNKYQSGMPEIYEKWMVEHYGQHEVDRLRVLDNQVSKKFDYEEMVELRIQFMDRTKAAIQRMEDR